MSAYQSHAVLPAFVDGWKRRSLARTALSALVYVVMIVYFGAADGPMGVLLFVLVLAACLGDIVYSWRLAASLSTGTPPNWRALSQREQKTLQVTAWAGYLPAVALLIKAVRHSFGPMGGMALAFFIAVALFTQLVLLPRARQSGARLGQRTEVS